MYKNWHLYFDYRLYEWTWNYFNLCKEITPFWPHCPFLSMSADSSEHAREKQMISVFRNVYLSSIFISLISYTHPDSYKITSFSCYLWSNETTELHFSLVVMDTNIVRQMHDMEREKITLYGHDMALHEQEENVKLRYCRSRRINHFNVKSYSLFLCRSWPRKCMYLNFMVLTDCWK